ncbi:MAG: hypothetical protein PHE20_00340 [Patescibacteria group bacterium]|nr:hypothetical protein [Patescibacteria group bacterium]
MKNRSNSFFTRQKVVSLIILSFFATSLFVLAPSPVNAQTDANQAVNNVLTPIWAFLKKAYEKGGASAFQKTVRTALNKVAFDTATWLGSGKEGQKPMFVDNFWGYIGSIGDEAAGQFIEDAVSNWNRNDWDNSESDKTACQQPYAQCLASCDPEFSSTPLDEEDDCKNKCNSTYATCLNKSSIDAGGTTTTGRDGVTSRQSNNTVSVCQPSSIDAKLRIAMGLVDYNRPQAPNCSASELISNWGDYAERMTAFKDPDFLDNFSNLFNPVSNDLGIYYTLRTDMTKTIDDNLIKTEKKLIADGGWLDMQDIAGNLVGMPGDAETKAEIAEQGYINNMATFSGDALIDAANVFLNQLAMTAYSKYMSNLGKVASSNSSSINNPNSDPNIRYGEAAVRESAASIIEPDFGVRADYDILSTLSMCRDRENPGPTDCVIDDKLMQAITEKKTVAEAVKDGYLHKNWLFSTDYLEGNYNLRNLEIMRKYRLIPVSWEVAAAANKQASLIDLISCFSASDDYNEYSSNFNVGNQTWCRNLVDPNWVLKAPLNYCAKQGYSAQIFDISVIPTGIDGQADTIQITRADDYCADEQSCIQERADGSCEAYGYCQSERRTWSFDSKSCEPINNTCSSFINTSSNQRTSYLENTLDYANCNADSVGCKRYSLFGIYDTDSGQVNWSESTNNSTYFNNNLSNCSPTDEACTEMIRVKPGWGLNLVMGADFANDNIGDAMNNSQINKYWNIWSPGNKEAEIISASDLDSNYSGKVLFLKSASNAASSTIGVFSDNAVSLIPANFNILSDETYTLSADVYIQSGDKVHLVLGGDYLAAVETRDQGVWRHISVTRNLKDKPLSEMDFSVVGYSNGSEVAFGVRNIKLEMTAWDSGFSNYGSFKVYEQLIPSYLASACYVNADPGSPDYRLKTDAPSICKDYARQCNREEVGCESYKEASTGFTVAAQAVSSDYCDASCNGYDLYVSKSSYFYSPYAEKMIPENSNVCGAEAAGCSEFTNLDAVAAGGEGLEYYTELKQCIKPSDSCADFYTWVGTEESGYQLKTLSLKKDNSGNPAVTTDDSQICNQAIFNLTPDDPNFNADCRQFYNKAGNISYHLSAYTITCSENCHAYRLTENNIDSTVSQANCSGSDRSWNASSSVCYVCKNGGIWSGQDQACVYQAIPNEGKKCSARQNGCREYNGSLGNNIRMIGVYSFENGLDGWVGQCGDAAMSSQVVNTNNGRSLLYDRGANINGSTQATDCEGSSASWLDKFLTGANASFAHISKTLGSSVVQGGAYNIKFTASASANTNVQVALMNGQGELSYFNTSDINANGSFIVSGDNEWRTYELNLSNLNHTVDSKETLVVMADRDFYLDNFILTAITDRYYLIKNTSNIPDVCYYDMLDNYQGSDYNLGCSLYHDRAGSNHYLRQFSNLCQDSAVGCELMINTANYNDYKSGIWQDTNDNGACDTGEEECVKVNGDSFFYAIYDESKRCNSADLGCSRLGESLSTGTNYDWSDVFKRNNPNNYDKTLCAAADAGCEAWNYADGSGISYFKNPGSDACVYRISSDPTRPGKAWYKVPVMRCDLDSSGKIDGTEIGKPICATNSDCTNNSACLVDNNDYDCPVSYFKTFGFGGGGNQVPTPSESAALCESANSGCSEYIDPVSIFAENVILDPARENGSSSWSGNPPQQNIVIEPNKVYIFSVNAPESLVSMDFNVRITFPVGVYVLQEDNNLSTIASTTLTIPSEQPSKRIMFHSRTNTSATVSGASSNYEILLKAAVLDYQFKQNIDKTSCNGIVNFDNGCVLFNERSINGAQGVLSLSGGWNAAASKDGQTPVLCSSGDCSANQLIKVRPDRVCSSWLDCLTYAINPETQEKTCYALGLCNQLNDNNECSNFVATTEVKLPSNDVNINKLTGYSLLNKYNLASMKEVGLNTGAHYNFEAGTQSLDCKNDLGGSCVFDQGLVADSIINSPNNSPTDYPAEGAAYLRVMVGQQTSPHSVNSPISVQSGQDYYLNYLVNTKGSGYEAKVSIYDNARLNSDAIATATSSATNGWERKVFKFNVAPSTKSINIYLGANNVDNKEERYVYFDDINIEPVLQVANNEYVAKECRLYPSQDATSCTSKNSQVVSDGLVGYCLQHDPANSDVCLVWYPVDEISSASKSGRSNLGYQGAFPLNYCTQANGNFDLVEKRISIRLDDAHSTDENEWGDDKCVISPGCAGDQNYNTMIELNNGDVSAWLRVYCVPDPNKLLFVTSKKLFGGADACRDKYLYEGWGVYDGLKYIQSGQYIPDNCGNNCDVHCETGTCKNLDEATSVNPNIRVFNYDYPTVDEEQLKLISSSDPDDAFYPTCNQFVQVVDAAGNNKAWTGRTSKTSIYPFNTPLFFRYNNTYYGPGCYLEGAGECMEYCTCDNGCVCDPIHGDHCQGSCAGKLVGDCKYYAGAPVSCDTPGAIPYPGGSDFNMTAYGRNRSLVPFGAATFPDNFNILASEPVKFLNQYSSKIDQKTFAGRPYGCSGVGCDNIGYCSLNPNVMCLLDTTTSANTSLVNQKSCGSSNGTCIPLWNGDNISTDTSFKADNVLRNIFNTSFGEFNYNNQLGTYDNMSGNNYPVIYTDDYTPTVRCSTINNHLSTNDGNYNTYNCAIWPRVSSVKLDGFNVPTTINPGIHVLSFNTIVDTEQQPLKDLIIDWGDGSVQNLVNQDHHPDANSPHKVYHYYANSVNNAAIKIKVTDNWNTFCCVRNNSSCSAANCP